MINHRFPVPVFSGDRNDINYFLKLFRPWCHSQNCDNALFANESMKMIGVEREEIEHRNYRSLLEQCLTPWSGLMKSLERDEALLNMLISEGTVPGAWKSLPQL